MNLHVFCIHISIMLLLQYALSKTLPEINENDSESDENEISDEKEALHETRHRSLKHIDNQVKRQNRRRRSFDETYGKMRQCAVMYKNEEPVGILQQVKDSYQLLPIHADESIPVDLSPMEKLERDEPDKRETQSESAGQEDEIKEKSEDVSSFADEKYPYIFAKFKIDSRVGKDKARSLQKRESKNPSPSLFSQKHVNSLKIGNHEEGAEDELKDILNDMGLIDEPQVDKREADLIEDEDMELGTNKINLIKAENDNDRNARDESAKKSKHKKSVTPKQYGMINIPEPKSIDEDEYVDQYMNKHPEQFDQPMKKEREKRSEDTDDVAEQMERQIKERLQKIKEEVRNEIEQIKTNDNDDFEEGEEEDADEEEEKSKSQRRKRNAINTLVEEETSDVDPVLFGDNNLTPHIRRRRSLDYEDDSPAGKTDARRELKSLHLSNLLQVGEAIKSVDQSSTISTSIEKEDNLIIDLNSDTVVQKDSQKPGRSVVITSDGEMEKEIVNDKMGNVKNDSKHEDSETINSSKREAARVTTDHFLIRSLKEFKEEANNNYEDLDVDFQNDETNSENAAEENTSREKKACKCEGKGCKCGGSKPTRQKPLIGEDGSNFVYFDGAPMLAFAPFDGSLKDANKASMQSSYNKRPNKQRPTRQNEAHAFAKTKKTIRGLRDGGYTLDLDPDIYRITDEKPNSLAARKKRFNSFNDLVAIHGGGPVLNHLVAIRERSMLPRIRVKRRSSGDGDGAEPQLSLADMSGDDLFGALPQNFESERARYKRVKRAKV